MLVRRKYLLPLLTIGVLAQIHSAHAQEKAISTSVCEVTKYPAAFNNKLVRFRATYVGNFEVSSLRDANHRACAPLSFAYPGSHSLGVSLSLGTAEPRPTVYLKDDEQLHRFQRLLNAEMYPRRKDMGCMDCRRYEVTAVMTGLIEYAGAGLGFGHMNMFSIQFVLQSVKRTTVRDLASKYNATDFSTTPIRFPTGYVTGSLIGPDDQPIVGGEVNIYPATKADPSAKFERDVDSARTDKQGHFNLAVPPGHYIVGFNTFWVPSPDFPFPPTYYSSTPHRSEAEVIIVADREQVGRLIFKLPQRLVRRSIPAEVIWPDGAPVENANVWLSQVSDPTQVVGMSVSHTDSKGSFELVGFEGIDYILHADKYAGLGRVTCAKVAPVKGNQPVQAYFSLTLNITDFHACQNSDYDVPIDSAAQN